MSIVLIVFPGAPKVSEEAVKKEKELEQLIRKELTADTVKCKADCMEQDEDDRNGLSSLVFLPSATMQSKISSLFERPTPDDAE
ncbi:hypothetical protein Avbf_01562 [Armadillidium vulgare]|nr:hypothetical protein Avbf_01562 [Armadillidium vulgare]